MVLKFCCICLFLTDKLKKLISQDKDDIKLITKLEDIAPEHCWLEIFSICEKCDIQLDNAYYFKKLCVENETVRKEFNCKNIPTNSTYVYLEDDLKADTLSIKADDAEDNFYEGHEILDIPIKKTVKKNSYFKIYLFPL